MQYWQQQQQNTLNTDFHNLQFTKQSQHSQTETNEVPETPTSPPNKFRRGGKRKSKKNKDPEPINDDEKKTKKSSLHVGNQVRKTYLQRVQRVQNDFNKLNFRNATRI
jgi:hypothetical protein